jgi:hypothetical protein
MLLASQNNWGYGDVSQELSAACLSQPKSSSVHNVGTPFPAQGQLSVEGNIALHSVGIVQSCHTAETGIRAIARMQTQKLANGTTQIEKRQTHDPVRTMTHIATD